MASAESSSSKRKCRNESELDFISAVPNDVLLQIFVRLPHVRSVIQCSAVCKRWSSLISKPPSSFIRNFVRYHEGKMSASDSLPYTKLLYLFDGKLFYQLFSQGSKILHRKANQWSDSFCYLDFLPWPRVCIQAYFDDLLLVTPSVYDPRPFQYCICNSLTKQWLILPLEASPVPHHHNARLRHGLVCKSDKCSNDDCADDDNNIRYKVVRIDSDSDSFSAVGDDYVLPLTIFCSESGKWSQSTLLVPSLVSMRLALLSEPIGTSNGILHFPLEHGGCFTGATLAFDAFDDTGSQDPKQSRFINRPDGFSPTSKSCFGTVKGQLRLWWFRGLFMRIWELNYEHQISSDPPVTPWRLLYKGRVKRPIARRMFMAGFDPDNGSVVFFMSESGGIYKYNFEEEEYEEVGKIPANVLSKGVMETYSNYMRSFTLVHPIWPTVIPPLPIP